MLNLADIAHELRPSLARLDNFEAMAWGPALADGTRTLLLASDDNFSATQQNAFVLLRVTGGKQDVGSGGIRAADRLPPPQSYGSATNL